MRASRGEGEEMMIRGRAHTFDPQLVVVVHVRRMGCCVMMRAHACVRVMRALRMVMSREGNIKGEVLFAHSSNTQQLVR